VSPCVLVAPDQLLVLESSGITTCPVAPDIPPDREGLRCCHVSRSSRPAPGAGGLWHRHVPPDLTPGREGLGFTMCPAALDPPYGVGGLWCHHVQPGPSPGREGLWCRHMSYGSRSPSRCGRALASPCAPCHRARHPRGKGSGVTMCPAAPDSPPGAGGL
jgi:hypothetical protein